MGCNKCNSNCGCNCGCNNVSYGSNKSCNQSYSGIYFCKDPICYVKTNFVVPAANVILEISVTDSSKLYVGEGVRIGDGFFQVVSIADSTHISIAHNGTATPNLQITAIQPSYGCYQFPILAVGKVSLLTIPELLGLDNLMTTDIAASIINTTTNILTYGYLGPNTVQFDAEVVTDTANTPYWLAIPLPFIPIGSPLPSFSGTMQESAGKFPAVAMLGEGAYSGYAVIGHGSNTVISNGVSRIFRVSGIVEI